MLFNYSAVTVRGELHAVFFFEFGAFFFLALDTIDITAYFIRISAQMN